ncbi:hypothetical protein ACFYY5_26250 [Nocardia elegans]|uniref:Porin n=1 Tax=Nocardia elegans TaxID=300029 RepID=A0ABW6TJP3_9NOCA
MTGSYSKSASSSFTISDARYVGGRVAADLRLLYNLYGGFQSFQLGGQFAAARDDLDNPIRGSEVPGNL